MMGAQPVSRQQSLRFGDDFALESIPRRLCRSGRALKLERIPLEILFLLVERRGEIVTREEIVPRIWGTGVFLDTDNSIRGAIRKIRQVLKDDPEQPRFIQTITGQGYRFIAPVTVSLSGSGADTPIAPQPVLPAQTVTATLPQQTFRKWPLVAAAFAIALLALALLGARRIVPGSSKGRIRSIAVLPLKNLSGDPSQDYLADGITDELTGRLSNIKDLRVISATSAMRYKEPKQPVPKIAKDLNVDAVVEGSVTRDGSRIRIIAQLVRGATDEHFWSESYDRDFQDVLSLESDVAQSIARKVEVTVTGEEHTRLVAARHVAPEVYESYLKGLLKENGNGSRSELESSVACFRDAIAKDPTFAPAYLGLAEDYISLGTIFVGAPPKQMRENAVRAARKALELDPTLAEAHAVLAHVYQLNWQWAEAETEYKRALDLKPNDARSHHMYAFWLVTQGRTDEAIRWVQRGRELDPIAVQGTDVAWILLLARRYDDALRELQGVLAVKADDTQALWDLGFVFIRKGEAAKAVPLLETAVTLTDRGPGAVELLATAYAQVGRRRDALRLLEELKRRREKGYIPAGAFINPYIELGDYDQAFMWFEQAYREQSTILQFLKVHPHFDPVRNDPRYLDLLRRVGLGS